MSAEDLLDDLESESPALVRLAEAVSLAALVDPPLLRRARLTLVPEADAGLEADLWLSPLVQTRGPQGIVFAPDVAEELRERLGKSSQRLEQAWEITRDLHRHLSPAVRLEEEVAWLSVAAEPDDERIEKLLHKALAALVLGERRGLAHWAARALPRLPLRARKTQAAQMLQTGAELRLGGGAGIVEEPPEWLSWVAPTDLPRVPVRVRLLPGQVELEAGATGGESILQVPQTDPLLIDVLWQDPAEGDERSEQVTLRPGERRSVEVPARTVRLRTILGEVYELRPEGLPGRRLADHILDFSAERARHRPFFGREEELTAFDKRISEISGGGLLVDGPTGIGKTAFLSRFLDLREERGNLPPHHFFRRGDPRLEDLAAAEESLVAQIAARFPEIAPTAPGRSLREVLTDLEERGLLSGEPLVLVLDGFEAIRNVNRDDLKNLQIYGFPGVVVVTTDHRLFPQTLNALTLEPPEEALRAFWEHHGPDLRLEPAEIEIAVRASEGNFGLAQVLRHWLESGSRDLFETKDRRGVFQKISKRLKETLGDGIRNLGLGALAVALGPMPDSLVTRLLGPNHGTFDPLARTLPAPSPKGEPVSELREEVLRELIATRLDLKTLHQSLAQASTSDLSPEKSTPQLREYGFRHGIAHWLAADELEQADRFCTDAGFLTAGCREVGPEVILRALDESLAINRGLLKNRDIKGVRDVIAERAPLLRVDPEALPGLLYDRFRAAGGNPSEIRKSLRISSGIPLLRPKFPTALELPGPSRHRGSVVGCAFTDVEGPNTDIVLSWSTDGTLNLWRADGGELISTIAGHSSEITGCALLPEDRAVSCSRGGSLRLWNLRTSSLLGVFCSHEGPVLGVVAIDARRVVSWSEDCTLRVWDVEDERELFVLRGHDRAVTACAVLGEDWLVSGSADSTVRLWSLEDGQLLRTYRGHQAAVTGIVAAPDGRHVFSCSLDRTIRVWSLESAYPSSLVTFGGHSLGILGLALSPGGRSLASWSYDRTVKIWDPSEARLLSTLTGHAGAVLDCAFLADGMRLVSGSADRTMRLWIASTGELLDLFEGHERSVRCLAIEPRKGNQPERIASGSDDRTLRLWSSETGLETTSLGGSSEEISRAFPASEADPGYESILFGNRRGTLEIRNVEEEERQEKGDPFWQLKLPLQGGVVDDRHHYMVAWGWDGEQARAHLRVLDLKEDPGVATLAGHEGPVLACAFTRNSERLLSASMDHTICVWSVNPVQSNPIGVLQGHTGPVSDIKIGPGDQVVLSASWDGTLRLWSLFSEYPVRVFEGHTDRVLASAIHPDGRLAVSASADRTLRLWDLETGTTVRVLSGHSAEVTGCAFTSGGSKIISRSLDGTLRAWDVPSKRGATVFEGHSDWVNAFALDEEHGLLYSCSEDRTVRAWDLRTGEPQGVVYGVAPFRSLASTRTGVCAGDEAGNFWVLEHERAVQERPEGSAA
ncbi:MAG TPA: WD40 repeat domain-containing protein [Thermoanaerobaculia bacterium]|nr:WD40 repeat domain-containing protein [Thermoanaerobaculia bacterium]